MQYLHCAVDYGQLCRGGRGSTGIREFPQIPFFGLDPWDPTLFWDHKYVKICWNIPNWRKFGRNWSGCFMAARMCSRGNRGNGKLLKRCQARSQREQQWKYWKLSARLKKGNSPKFSRNLLKIFQSFSKCEMYETTNNKVKLYFLHTFKGSGIT